MRASVLTALISLWFLAICGCSSSGEEACATDEDCSGMTICLQGHCITVDCKQDGDCDSGLVCLDYQCQQAAPCNSDKDCQPPTPFCDPVIGRCVECVPDCDGSCCGPDSCGSVCPDRCSLTGQTCNSDTCRCEGECQPDCAGKQCGPDGCGNSCPPGCGAGEFCNQGECQSLECLDDQDCPGEKICSGGVCADAPSCESSDDCEMGQICEGGQCLTGCRSDRDCPRERHCVVDLGPNGTCVECESDSDCAAGKICADYGCITHCTEDSHCAPRYCDLASHQCVDCTGDEQCPPDQGLICLEHQCVEGCREDADCESGHCNTQTNQCIECHTTDDCPLGSICFQQKCLAGCQSNRDCPGELMCDPDMGEHGACVECLEDSHCSSGYVCSGGMCEFFCSSDEDCQPPEPACDSLSGTCVPCVSNQHCEAGTVCVENACLPGCEDSQDCPPAMVCDPDLGQHGGCVECLLDADCPSGYSCENNACVLEGSQMVRIIGGTFVMGSDPGEGEDDEMPEHTVSLPTFYIDRSEVTNDQYRACVQAGVCYEPLDMTAYNDPAKADHPVVYVTRTQAYDFCTWMGKSLPSEARWERAARGPGPQEKNYPWGDGLPDCSRANYSGCTADTRPVGSHPQGATPEGALDMAGNVYEWVYDYYDAAYYSSSTTWDDPTGPVEGEYRIVRGGSFDSLAGYLRCANRAPRLYDDARADTGFRCAMRGVPSADIIVAPEYGPFVTTTFTADASGSTDPNHPTDVLEVRWDWENDGIYDTGWSLAKIATHRYPYNGIFRIRGEVRDPDGNTSTDSMEVVAEGTDGWDGAACETDQDCAHGFGCIMDMGLFQYLCRENCGMLLDPVCHIAGQSCSIWFDPIGSGFGAACQPGG